MKIRNGFVSNSSSSSFIVMYKNDYFKDDKKKLKAYIANSKVFYMDKKCIFYKLQNEIIDLLLDGTEYIDIKEFKEDNAYWDEDEYSDIEHLMNLGFTLIYGSVSDEDYTDIGAIVLSNLTFDYEDENIKLYKEESR